MAQKITTSSATINTKDNITGKSSSITRERITRRKLSASEQAQGGLSNLARLEMIGITILTISIGTSVSQFTTSDLIEITPNYQTNNTYIPIEDPLETINYAQYGEEVFDNAYSWIQALSATGQWASAGVNTIVRFFENPVMSIFSLEDDPNLSVFNWYVKANRILTTIENAQAWYDQLTIGDQINYELNIYPDIFFLLKWQYYSPAELTA